MEDFVPVLGVWFWWIAAGILLILELLAPGIFLIWLGIAAAITAAVDMAVPMTWQGELLVFAAASAVSVFVGRAVMARRGAVDHPFLNRRNLGYVGSIHVLQNAIVDGRGKLAIEGTVWEIQGPDLPPGTHVKVTGTAGLILVVEAA